MLSRDKIKLFTGYDKAPQENCKLSPSFLADSFELPQLMAYGHMK